MVVRVLAAYLCTAPLFVHGLAVEAKKMQKNGDEEKNKHEGMYKLSEEEQAEANKVIATLVVDNKLKDADLGGYCDKELQKLKDLSKDKDRKEAIEALTDDQKKEKEKECMIISGVIRDIMGKIGKGNGEALTKEEQELSAKATELKNYADEIVAIIRPEPKPEDDGSSSS